MNESYYLWLMKGPAMKLIPVERTASAMKLARRLERLPPQHLTSNDRLHIAMAYRFSGLTMATRERQRARNAMKR
jgi:hypothetical protein